jgi:hypothetical protein
MKMNRIVVRTKVNSDGVIYLNLPVGTQEAGSDVLVKVEPVVADAKSALSASDLVRSGLVGMWASRTDIDDNHAFARRLRERAQTRRHDQ